MPEPNPLTITSESTNGSPETKQYSEQIIKKPKIKEVCLLKQGKAEPVWFREIMKKAEGMKHPYFSCNYYQGKITVCERLKPNHLKIPKPVIQAAESKILCLRLQDITFDEEIGSSLTDLKELLEEQFGTTENVQVWMGNPPIFVAQFIA